MFKKMVGFLVATLLIATTIPAVCSINISKNSIIIENRTTQQLTRTEWNEMQKLVASDSNEWDYFGGCVSINDDYAVIGKWGDGLFRGSAYIFKRNGTIWSQRAKIRASDGEDWDSFGTAICIRGDYVVVGAEHDDSDRGSAYIFKHSSNNWIQEAKLIASDRASEDYFGQDVSISDDYAIVGAVGDDSNRGSVYVYKRNSENWSQEAKLIASDGKSYDMFGVSVSHTGDYLIIGARGDDSYRGSAYIFKRNGENWSQEAKLSASGGEAGDHFGQSVSIDGDYAIIGARGYDLCRGTAYIFKRSGTSWSQQARLIASDSATGDWFGYTVSIDGDYAIVGARDHGPGAAYIFKRSNTSWSEVANLKASDAASGDCFGWSVSISGSYAIVGAPHENPKHHGSAYVFTKENLPPKEPTINGPKMGKPGLKYLYIFTDCIDPNGDNMTYHVEWDDDTVDEGFVESGGTFTLSHIWDKKGNYLIKAKLVDVYGADSNWATLKVSIPRTRTYWLRFIDMFPTLKEVILRLIR